jgi:sugar lactone lactonase YvrE
MQRQQQTIATGLGFPEGPRWHEGRLYFSDFSRRVVNCLGPGNRLEVVARVANQPSGLGWLPDGRMLIVSMLDHRVLRLEEDGTLAEHADLSALATGPCNDMVVDASGRAYVGNFGANSVSLDSRVTASLARVDADGSVSEAASDLLFPNGAVITPDGGTLIIAETFARRLSAFDIDSRGGLSNRRLWADLGSLPPDGICIDREGAIWAATIFNEVVRVREGGEIVDRITVDTGVYACALGGRDGKSLFLCTAPAPGPRLPGDGSLLEIRVQVPAMS